jgi:hypothetical protein
LQLTGRNDHSVTLTITGYEFPNAEGLDEFDADEARLIVWFELELRPDWAKSGVAGQRDLSADLTVSRSELTQASRELRDQLAAFPSRAGAA